MGIAEPAEIAVEQVGMGIEMDHADRSIGGEAAQHRKRDEMVAARRHRGDAAFPQPGIEFGNSRHAVIKVDGVRPDIAQIGAIHHGERVHAGDRVHRPDHRRQVAQLARPVARSRPVGGAGVPWHADEPHLHLVNARRAHLQMRQAHEARHAGETRHLHRRYGNEKLVVRHLGSPVPRSFRRTGGEGRILFQAALPAPHQ